MRLWSIHPRHLDRQGLTGCWREALLAQAVLAGRTRGYRAHSQLVRFRESPDPTAAISAYLEALADEAAQRGYRFDRSRIDQRADADDAGSGSYDAASVADDPAPETPAPGPGTPRTGTAAIPVTEGQVDHEWEHLLTKLARRDPQLEQRWSSLTGPDVHPLFTVVPGPIEPWERTAH